MKIYLVFWDAGYEDHEIRGIYKTYDAAKEYCDRSTKSSYEDFLKYINNEEYEVTLDYTTKQIIWNLKSRPRLTYKVKMPELVGKEGVYKYPIDEYEAKTYGILGVSYNATFNEIDYYILEVEPV